MTKPDPNRKYPIKLDPAEEGGFTVTFPDFPEGVTKGDDLTEALAMAEDCLGEMVGWRLQEGEPIPKPSPTRGRHLVGLPLEVALEVAFHEAFAEAGITKAELARCLGWKDQQVQRIFEATHRTRIDLLGQALRALGRRFVVGLDAAGLTSASSSESSLGRTP